MFVIATDHHHVNPKADPTFLAPGPRGKTTWTNDISKARKFSREQDAKKVWKGLPYRQQYYSFISYAA